MFTVISRPVGLLLASIGMLLMAACADEDPRPTAADSSQGNDVPVTARALAAVAIEHTGEPSSAATDDDAAEEFTPEGVGAELLFGSDGEYDGDSLVVAVGSGLDKDLVGCANPPSYVSGCVEADGGTLFWEELAPEEDPGVIYVTVRKGDATVLMFYSGPGITGDPRDIELPISVDDLLAIANDPRVDLTTSQAAVDAGNAIEVWKG